MNGPTDPHTGAIGSGRPLMSIANILIFLCIIRLKLRVAYVIIVYKKNIDHSFKRLQKVATKNLYIDKCQRYQVILIIDDGNKITKHTFLLT